MMKTENCYIYIVVRIKLGLEGELKVKVPESGTLRKRVGNWYEISKLTR